MLSYQEHTPFIRLWWNFQKLLSCSPRFWKFKNCTSWSIRCWPTFRSWFVHPISMKLSQVVVNMLAMILEIKKKVLAGLPSVALNSDFDEILQTSPLKQKEKSLSTWPSPFPMPINRCKCVWTNFGKSMLCTWTAVCGLHTRLKTFWYICVRTICKN